MTAVSLSEAALAIAAQRLKAAGPNELDRCYDQFAARNVSWQAGPDSPGWWKSLVALDAHALSGGAEIKAGIEAVLAAARGEADVLDASLGLLMSRFLQRFQWDMADLLDDAARDLDGPAGLRRQDFVKYVTTRRRFAPGDVATLRQIQQADSLSLPIRCRIREHILMAEGASPALLEEALADASDAGSDGGGLAAGQSVAMAFMLHGMPGACDVLRRFPQAVLQGGFYLPVAAAMPERFAGLAGLLAASAEATARLRDALADTRRSVAVVGNGLPGGEYGDAIDRHDIVIRFNDFRLAGRRAELGRRTDLVCTSLIRSPGLQQPNLHAARYGALLPQHRPWVRADWTEVAAEAERGTAIAFLPDEALRREHERELGVFMSSGLLVLALLRDLRGGLDPESIYGMPLLRGAGDGRRVIGDPSHNGHYWGREAALLARLLGE
jgi:hypothetical protein